MTKERVVDWWVSVNIVNCSIAQSATRRHLSNSEADFEFFRPAGATRCTDGGEIVNWLQTNCNRKWKSAKFIVFAALLATMLVSVAMQP